MGEFGFGRGRCCWKPQGCTMTAEQGCQLMKHPVKRAMLLDDRTAPCPKGWQDPARPGVNLSCALLNGHAGVCVERGGELQKDPRCPACDAVLSTHPIGVQACRWCGYRSEPPVGIDGPNRVGQDR